MKKLLSILLAACMLLTMLSLPAVAVEAQAEGDTYEYFKFPFNGDPGYTGDKCYYGLLKDDGSADAFWQPIRVSDGSAAIKVEMKQVDYNGARALRVRVAGGTAGQGVTIVPRTTNADARLQKPIKLTPGKNYAINYNIDITRYGNTSTSGRLMSEAYIVANGSADSSASLPSASAITVDVINKSPAPVSGKDMRRAAYYFTTAGATNYKLLQGDKSASSSSVNIGAFGGLYSFAPTTINKYTSLGLTQMTGTITSNGSAVASSNNGTGKKTIQKREVMNALPVSDVEGDWNDLADWGITPRMASDGQFTGFYNYDYQANGTDDTYTDHFGITLPTNSSAEYIKVGEDFEAMAGTTIESGGETYGLAYNEYYIYDLEYYDTDNGAVNFVNGDDTTTVVGAVSETVTAPADPTKTDMVFIGWYDAEGNKFEAGATFAAGEPKTYTAKFAANAVTLVDDVTIAGKDVQLNAVNYINGTAVSSYAGEGALSVTDKALVLTAPQSKEIGSTFTSSKEADYIMSAYRGDYHAYTLVGADGKPLVAESNTNYIVNISYKQTKPGRLGIKIGFGRDTAKATTVNGDHSAIGQNGTEFNVINRGNRGIYYINFGADGFPTTYNQGSNANESVEANVDTKVQTYSFGLNSGDLSSKIPEINLVTANYGVTGKLVSTSEGTSTYEVVGVPEVEIYSIQIVKVATGETVVAFTNNNPGYGDSLVYRAGTPGAAVENVPANFEGKWYNSTASTAASNTFDNMYPAATKTVYGYACVQNYSAENAASLRSYVGTKGFSMVNVDGKEMLQYKTLTNDECTTLNADKGLTNKTAAEWAGYTDDQKLAIYNEFYGRQLWNMYRLPVAETVDGHTYKATFTYKATGSMDMNLRLTLGKETNASDNDADNFLKETKTITDTNGEWTTATIFFTVDHKATVVENTAGADDTFTKKSSYIFLHFYAVEEITDASLPDRLEITFSDIAVKDLGEVIGIEGASKLEDSAATEAGSQAMRVYFSYETTTGSNIFVDDVEYTVVNRGFVYKNGAIDRYTTNGNYNADMRKENSMIESEKTSGFNTGWAYDTENNRLWFSNYIAGFDSTMLDNKIIARGYVTFTDGTNTYTIYSDTINRSINGISHLIGDDLGNL